MSEMTSYAPCGCTFKARNTGESLAARSVSLWELHHCPLHAAAGELLDVAEELLAAYCELRERLYNSDLPSPADADEATGLKHSARAVIALATGKDGDR